MAAKVEPKIGEIKNGKVFRFTTPERVSHWVHTVSYFMLLLTGLVIFIPGGGILGPLFGGANVSRILHRIFAVPYALLSLPILYFGAKKQAREWFRLMFTWTKEDVVFFLGYMPELMGRHNPNLPESDKFNAGEKFNSLLTFLTGIGLTLSGIIMWFPAAFPKWLVRLAYPIHDLCWLGMTAMLVIHIFLSVFHPRMRAALEGMLNGWVDTGFAREHYPKWFRAVTGK